MQTKKQLQDIVTNAKAIFRKWLANGTLTEGDVERVLDGQYNFYVTFLRKSEEHGIDSSRQYVVLMGLKSLEEAHEEAYARYNGLVRDVVTELDFEPNRTMYVAYVLDKKKGDLDGVS